MRKLTILSLAFAAVLLAIGTFLPVTTSGHQDQRLKFRPSSQPAANRYIVVLKSDASDRSIERSEVEDRAVQLTSAYGGQVRSVYSNAIHGYSAAMSAQEAMELSRDENVEYVEEDSVISVSETQANAGWHLDRIDQRNLPMDTNYTYTQTGAGAHVYIIDTGIRISHQDFGGRASVAFDALNDGQNGLDCHGHGTHVAGTVGGTTYGVAKNVSLHSVRVLPCGGSGLISDLMFGIDWVTLNRINPAVANISITAAGVSSSLETMVSNSIGSGVVYTIAAGNNAMDACGFTPARTTEAITVGATYQLDARAPYSNYGPCVDVFAPGYQVISAGRASDTAAAQMNGSSMAAPQVAGVAAVYRAANPSASASAVSQAVLNGATNDIVTSAGSGSPTKLLYSWVASGPPATPTPTATPTSTPTPSPTPQAARITIRKAVRITGGGTSSTTSFPYSATNISTAAFALSSNQEFTEQNVSPGTQMIQVTEASVQGWQLMSLDCVEAGGETVPNTTIDLANRRANIMVENGESITCTFTSDAITPTAGDASIQGRIVDQQGRSVRGITLSLFDARTGETRYAMTSSFGYYSFTELDVMDFYVLTAHDNLRYTIPNNQRSFMLHDNLAGVDFIAHAWYRW